MKPIKLKVTINLLTPLHIGGDLGADPNTATILRGADDKAYYPGSAFKGKVRHYALQLQNGDCLFPDPCGCAVCRLFGGEGNSRGSLFFSDFHAAQEQATDIRVGNSIDRYRRVAEDDKLFTTESASIDTLIGTITGNADDGDMDILKASIRLIRQIGGNTSRGLGWVKDEILIEEEDAAAPATQVEAAPDSDAAACVRIQVTPISPLLIGTHTTESNFRDTQHVIPGAVMRAAFARAICEQDGITGESENSMYIVPRQTFTDLKFSALYSRVQLEPYPITARKCKLDFEYKHGAFDVLAALLNGDVEKCPVCGGRLEKIDPHECATITSIHSEMDKLRGTSMDERLYTIRAIAPVVTFCGTISGAQSELTALSQLLHPPLRVGAKLTAGFGECFVTFHPVAEAQDRDLREWIERFNELLNEDATLVPITLISDAVVDLEEPSGDTSADYTSAYADLVKPFTLERVITTPRVWRGFDTSQKNCFEKTFRYLLPAGSVFVVRVNALDGQTMDDLLKLEREGIGREKPDGYGAVRVAHNDHIKYALAAKGGNRNG